MHSASPSTCLTHPDSAQFNHHIVTVPVFSSTDEIPSSCPSLAPPLSWPSRYAIFYLSISPWPLPVQTFTQIIEGPLAKPISIMKPRVNNIIASYHTPTNMLWKHNNPSPPPITAWSMICCLSGIWSVTYCRYCMIINCWKGKLQIIKNSCFCIWIKDKIMTDTSRFDIRQTCLSHKDA